MKFPFLQLTDVTEPMVAELVAAAGSVIRSGWFLNGPHTREFERNMARLCETEHCVAVSNGLDAIRLSVRALMETGRLKAGDEVMAPANTYIASILPLTEFGLKPVLVEPSPSDYQLDAKDCRRKVTERTRALVTVHLYGTPAWPEGLMRELEAEGVCIIEDNAQAIGARSGAPGLAGTHATGGLGHIAATSFYPTKNVGALGDAGAVTTSDPELAACVRALANYGADRRYHNVMTGYNCRMDEIQAAMLNVKLARMEEGTQRRIEAARAYCESIRNPMLTLPGFSERDRQVWHQFVVRVADGRRDELMQWLAQEGVGTDIHYAVPPHRQPCYWPSLGEDYPVTDMLASEIVSLPIGAVTASDAREIAGILNRFR